MTFHMTYNHCNLMADNLVSIRLEYGATRRYDLT